MDALDQSEDNSSPVDAVSAWASETLVSLMTQNGVTSRHQAALIAQICRISVSQARRKLHGAVWLFGEVLAVCQHFNKTLDEVWGQHKSTEPGTAAIQSTKQPTATVPATLLADEQQLACDIQIGAQCSPSLGAQTQEGLIAIHQGVDGWLVGSPQRMAQAPHDGPHYAVSKLTLQTQTARSRANIAILDDDAGSAGALTDWFNELGYRAQAYTTADQLLGTPLTTHDAFIVDLILGGGQTSQGVVEQIRRERPQVPIVLLTGQLRDGTASETTLSTILRTQGVTFFEKPVRPAVLTAAIQSSLDRLSA